MTLSNHSILKQSRGVYMIVTSVVRSAFVLFAVLSSSMVFSQTGGTTGTTLGPYPGNQAGQVANAASNVVACGCNYIPPASCSSCPCVLGVNATAGPGDGPNGGPSCGASCGPNSNLVSNGTPPSAGQDPPTANPACPNGPTFPAVGSNGSFIDNSQLTFHHWGWDVVGGSSGSVGLLRMHRPRDMAICGTFGPGVFSNFDSSITLDQSSIMIAGVYSFNASIFDPQSPVTKYYTRPNALTTANFSLLSPLRRDTLKALVLLQSDLTPIVSTNTSAFHGAAFIRADSWDGSFVLYKMFDVGTANRRIARPVKFSNTLGETNIVYKTFTAAELTASPTRALQINTVTDRFGGQLSFTYSTTSIGGYWVVSSVTAPDATTRTYGYSTGTASKLATVTYPSGPTTTIAYGTDAASQSSTLQITDRTAPAGHQSKTIYLSNVGVLGTASGGAESNPYVSGGSYPLNAIRMATNPQGEITFLAFRSNPTNQFNYEGGGKIKVVSNSVFTNAEEDFTVAYAKNGWSLTATTNSSFSFSGTLEEPTSHKRDPNSSSGPLILDLVNIDGSQCKYQYDSDNAVTSKFYQDGTFETFCYNSQKLVTRERNRLGNVIRRVWNTSGQLLEEQKGWKDNASNTNTSGYSGVGNYDRCATNDVQTSEYSVTKWEYIASGQPGAGMLSATIDPRGNRTDYQYNAQGRLWKILQPADTLGGTRPTTVRTYNTDGTLATITDPDNRVITYSYDWQKRVTQIQYGDGTSEKVEYGVSANDGGMVVKSIDRRSVVTTYAYDASQRLIIKVVGGFVRNGSGQDIATPAGMAQTEAYEYVVGTEQVWKRTVNGTTTENLYDYKGRLVESKVIPRSGKTLVQSQEYQKGLLYKTTDAYSRSTYYAYDATDARLVRTVTATVPEWTPPAPTSGQTYSQMLLAINRDATSNAKYTINDIVYDAAGRRSKTFDARLIENRSTFDALDRTTTVQAAFGTTVEAKTETLYDAASNVTEIRSPRYFDTTDTNGSTKAREQWTFTGRNLVATHTEAPGTIEAATESFTYTLSGRRATQVNFRGNTWTTTESGCCALTRVSIDPLGHGSITNANSKGQVVHKTTVSDAASHSASYNNPIDAKTLAESTTRYDERGRPIYQTTWLVPRGLVDTANPPIAGLNSVPLSDGLTTQYLYDDNLTDGVGLDNATGISVPKLGTGGTGNATITLATAIAKLADTQANGGAGITFSAANKTTGRASVSISPEDEISFTISDSTGRTVMSGKLNNYKGTGPTAANTLASWSCTLHDATANLVSYGTVLETRSIDALGFANRQWTDGTGRTMQSFDQLDKATVFTYDASGSQLSVRDPNSVGADMLYDSLGRNMQRTDTFGDVTKTDYDRAGNAIKQTDAKNKFTLISFDARNRRKSTSDRISAATTFTYLPTGQLASLTDGENQVTSYTYDTRGSKLTAQYPDHTTGSALGATGFGIVTFVYDSAGRMLRKQDQSGVTCTYNYDLAGRMTSRNYRTASDSPSGTIADSDTFTFDRAGRMLTALSGRYTNTVGYAYDLVGRKSSESLTIAAQTYTVGSAFNARNELTKHTYPDASIADRAYDARGALSQLKLDNAIIDTRTYDNGGRMATEVLGNAITETRTYRTDNLLSTISYSNTNIGNLSYSWDANKNKTAETIGGVMSGYGFSSSGTTYDFEDRLTGYQRASGTFTQAWSLTSVGDWTSVTTNGTAQTRTHGPTHELLTAGGSNVTTDVKGNMTVIPASLRESTATTPMNLTYDFDYRLRTADIDNNASADVSFEYDALGRRVARTQGSTAVVFFQADQQTIADYPRGGAATTASFRYVFGSYIDEPVVRKATGTGGAIVYYHRNQQYSIYALSDSSGTVTERYAYTAYGQPTFLNASATVQTSSAANNRYTYTAREWDGTIGLHHFRARFMSGLSGRFCSRDPIGFEGSPYLLYEYGDGMPLITVDPMGEWIIVVREIAKEIGKRVVVPVAKWTWTKTKDGCKWVWKKVAGPGEPEPNRDPRKLEIEPLEERVGEDEVGGW